MRNKQKIKGRNVHGVLLLDKPEGITSNQALQHVKQIFHARKAGHTGSLDKQASGLLPLCLGEATKLSGYLLDSDKHYLAVCKLGIQTTTGDREGEIVSSLPVKNITQNKINSVLMQFTGEIQQIPPMYSALKYKGKRLYQLAHQGIEVERKPRPVTIYCLDLLDFSGDELTIEVTCSKGTYIRTLAEDIGKALGCGAHVKTLRRIGSGPFKAEQMIRLADVETLAAEGTDKLDQILLPMDSILHDRSEVKLSESLVFYIEQGQPVIVPHAPTEGLVRLYDRQHRFKGVGEVLDDGRVAPRRLVWM